MLEPHIDALHDGEHQSLALDDMVTHGLPEIGVHSLGDQRLDAAGAVLGGDGQHAAGSADANAVEHQILDAVLFLQESGPGLLVLALLKPHRIVLAVGPAVAPGIHHQDAEAGLSIGLGEIVAVAQAFRSAGEDHHGIFRAEIVKLAVKIHSAVDDMDILLLIEVGFVPGHTDPVHFQHNWGFLGYAASPVVLGLAGQGTDIDQIGGVDHGKQVKANAGQQKACHDPKNNFIHTYFPFLRSASMRRSSSARRSSTFWRTISLS